MEGGKYGWLGEELIHTPRHITATIHITTIRSSIVVVVALVTSTMLCVMGGKVGGYLGYVSTSSSNRWNERARQRERAHSTRFNNAGDGGVNLKLGGQPSHLCFRCAQDEHVHDAIERPSGPYHLAR